MERQWMLVATVVLSLVGFAAKSEPAGIASPICSPDVKKPLLPAAAEKPAVKPAEKPAERRIAGCLVDEFNLPLVIELEVPKVPPEVQRSSSSVKELSRPAQKLFPGVQKYLPHSQKRSPRVQEPLPPINEERNPP